ncbi:unnamed protein product [Malus baccata var. baccata]
MKDTILDAAFYACIFPWLYRLELRGFKRKLKRLLRPEESRKHREYEDLECTQLGISLEAK